MHSLNLRQPLPIVLVTLGCMVWTGQLFAAGDAGSGTASPAATTTAAAGKPGPLIRAAGKPNGSGVVLSYRVPEKIAVGETVTIMLHFDGITAADGAAVEVREVTTRRQMLSLRLQPGEPQTVEFLFTALSDGMQYLDVTTRHAEGLSVQSLPLRVGSGKLTLKEGGRRLVTPAGEGLISLPSAK